MASMWNMQEKNKHASQVQNPVLKFPALKLKILCQSEANHQITAGYPGDQGFVP
jgi:hypothetical protein